MTQNNNDIQQTFYIKIVDGQEYNFFANQNDIIINLMKNQDQDTYDSYKVCQKTNDNFIVWTNSDKNKGILFDTNVDIGDELKKICHIHLNLFKYNSNI